MVKRNLIIFGTRPEAIKMTPLISAFAKDQEHFETRVCVTAQHREVLDQVLDFFGITPDYDNHRESPSKWIAEKVLQQANNETYYIVEPKITSHDNFELTTFEEALEEADILTFQVAHKEFKNASIPTDNLVLDFCGVTE